MACPTFIFRLFLLFLFLVALHAAKKYKDKKDEKGKKKDIRDYNDADMERLYEEWEVICNGFSRPIFLYFHIYYSYLGYNI